ncbi:uncharacterized protein LOC103062251 isoform X2 [Python bivittatus]|nr:uncharacterized protein LOC103062251 isoform X2 [Python bivittatus]XP_025031307.1 uncharacterized protein LOC103062251 isoform X2 [Python bivittatus]XP_025031308.1 uncharacterized protein LOC103062251 isoform X2 [Python bivittatus]XP_025031309.1 uncharacterized protein LOC103062251 isoform X2 [Python bivittatus]XP_025031310.1 uncharacterized protein LOC103062251 isoform X2 [Python bivittatus]
MATGPSELLEQSEECTDFVKELLTQKEDIQNQLKEGSKEDAKIPASQEEVNGKTNEIEEEEKNKLHILEKDLDEFVDSMTEATPSVLPKKSLEAEKHLLPEMAPAKLPRAEQVAEKVLRAEKVVERAQRVEKPPALEKVAEKVPRVEKAPQVEKAVRAEKTAEKPHLAGMTFSQPIEHYVGDPMDERKRMFNPFSLYSGTSIHSAFWFRAIFLDLDNLQTWGELQEFSAVFIMVRNSGS